MTSQICPYRDRCWVMVKGKYTKTRAELPFPCGFEQAGAVQGCPKARRLAEIAGNPAPAAGA